MATITKFTKMVIINDILQKMYGDKLKESNDKIEEFAQAAIKTVLSPAHDKVKKALGKEAREYVGRMTSCALNFGGSDISRAKSFNVCQKGLMNFNTTRVFKIDYLIPLRQKYDNIVVTTPTKAKKYQQMILANSKLKDEIRGEFRSLEVLMSSIRSEKKLLELFPDAGKYVSPKPVQATLPVPIAQVRKYNQALK